MGVTNAVNSLGATNDTNLLGTNGTNLTGTNGTNLLGATTRVNLLGTNGTNLLGTQPVNTGVNVLGDTPATNTSLVIVKVLPCTAQYRKVDCRFFMQSMLTVNKNVYKNIPTYVLTEKHLH